ncbi:hypothetical protein ACVWWD_000619 [Mesorhizobium sp. URHB0026]
MREPNIMLMSMAEAQAHIEEQERAKNAYALAKGG